MEKEEQKIQMTDEQVKEIIKDLIKRCDTNPKQVAKFIYNVGRPIFGNLYEINKYTDDIEKTKKEFTVESFIEFYKSHYGKKPTQKEIKEHMDFIDNDEIGYYQENLNHDLLVDSIFYETGIKNQYITGDWKNIFNKEQVELIYKTIEKYVIENKKTKVILAKLDYDNSCVDCFEEKYEKEIKKYIKKNCSIEEKINISKKNDSISDINLENDIKEKLLKNATAKNLLKYLKCFTNAYYKDKKDKAQNEKNCQEVANLLFKHIIENKDKKLCKRILLSTNENDTSDHDMENIIDLFNIKELFMAYIAMCSEKEVKEFVGELQSNKHSNDYPNQNESMYDLCGYGY